MQIVDCDAFKRKDDFEIIGNDIDSVLINFSYNMCVHWDFYA